MSLEDTREKKYRTKSLEDFLFHVARMYTLLPHFTNNVR